MKAIKEPSSIRLVNRGLNDVPDLVQFLSALIADISHERVDLKSARKLLKDHASEKRIIELVRKSRTPFLR